MESRLEHTMSGYVSADPSGRVKDKVFEISDNTVIMTSMSRTGTTVITVPQFKRLLQDTLEYIDRAYHGI